VTFNTTSDRQSISDLNYRGSYTAHLTPKQLQNINLTSEWLNIYLEDLWYEFFDDEYDPENWYDISINAASEIITHLIKIKNLRQLEKSFINKISRTEQEQHEWEMYPNGKL
jgi:hypothetical protein